MANQRSSNSRLLAIGLAVLVVGVLLVLVIIRNTDDQQAAPSPAATSQAGTEEPVEQPTQLTPQQISTARLPLPLEVPDGTEALAVSVNYIRSVAGIPAPGDLVNLYRFLPAIDPDAEIEESPTAAATERALPTFGLPDPGPDAQLVLPETEVLAVIGPLPNANGGTLSLVLAVPTDSVPGLMPLAADQELWMTLLPSNDGDTPTEEATVGTQGNDDTEAAA